MTEKLRVRVPALSQRTGDSFSNFQAKLGLNNDNLLSGGQYRFAYWSRNRTQLEAAYRGSWIVGQAVDVVADDMTRAGIEIKSIDDPQRLERMARAIRRTALLKQVNRTVKWSRLYGGAIGVFLIDGQDMATPLRAETVGKGQFRGVLPLDRWLVQPSLSDLVADYGPQLGYPKFYDVIAALPGIPIDLKRIHYSRVIRLDGVELPYYQRWAENGWGQSVLERIYDRMIAFDSATMGASQLAFRAYLRTLKVQDLRTNIASGGPMLEAVTQMFDMIRALQSNEGITLLDKEDEFETHTYSFSGLSDIILQVGQQLSGALGIPLVRLFGQSPAGLNSTGDSDIRLYYDMISARQESDLEAGVGTALELTYRSEFGEAPPEGFDFAFNPLWQMDAQQKSAIAGTTTDAVLKAHDAGVVSRVTALKELRQSSQVTGIWSNIGDEDITEAENEPPPASEALDPGGEGGTPERTPEPGTEEKEAEQADA